MASETVYTDKKILLNSVETERYSPHCNEVVSIGENNDECSSCSELTDPKLILAAEKQLRYVLKKNNFQVYISDTLPISVNLECFDKIYYRKFVDSINPKESMFILLGISYFSETNPFSPQNSPIIISSSTPHNVIVYSINISLNSSYDDGNNSLDESLQTQNFIGSMLDFKRFIFTLSYLCRHHLRTKENSRKQIRNLNSKPKLIKLSWYGVYGVSLYLLLLGFLSIFEWFSYFFNLGFLIFALYFVGIRYSLLNYLPRKILGGKEWRFNNYSNQVANSILHSIKDQQIKAIFHKIYLSDEKSLKKLSENSAFGDEISHKSFSGPKDDLTYKTKVIRTKKRPNSEKYEKKQIIDKFFE